MSFHDVIVYLTVVTGKINVWEPFTPPLTQNSSGSGFLLRDYPHYIFTNEHVVRDALEIQVRWPEVSGEAFSARVSGICRERDLAALKLDQIPEFLQEWKGFNINTHYLQLEPIIAAGYPLDNKNMQLNKGTISGINTDTTHDDYENPETIPMYYQITSTVNEGNSGGPLLNEQHELVGIVSGAIEDANFVAFAIPSIVLETIIDDLIEGHPCVLTKLSCIFQNGYPELYTYYNSPYNNGIYVTKVFPDTSFVGLQPSDIILAIIHNNKRYEMSSSGSLTYDHTAYPYKQILQSFKSYEKVECVVWRDRQELILEKGFDPQAPILKEVSITDNEYYILGGLCISPLTLDHIYDSKSLLKYLYEPEPLIIVSYVFPDTRASLIHAIVSGDVLDEWVVDNDNNKIVVKSDGKRLILDLHVAKEEDSKILAEYNLPIQAMILLR